jgi:hypothetical protein
MQKFHLCLSVRNRYFLLNTNKETMPKQTETELAAQKALDVIAAAACRATETVAQAAATAVKAKDSQTSTDHDQLIELKVLVVGIKNDIKNLSDGTATRITSLENEKLDLKDSYPVLYKQGVDQNLNDHETRLNTLESSHTKQTVLLSVGSGLMLFLVGLMIKHILG